MRDFPSRVSDSVPDAALTERSRQVQASIKAGYHIAVDLDLAKFFDNVQHDILMVRVARKVGDAGLLALIGRYFESGRHGRGSL
jgi:retron-type reverse transcriptase